MKVSSFEQGTPNWADLETSDDGAATAFYTALFGWQDDPMPMEHGAIYHMVKLDGDYVGAISKQDPQQAGQGIPPHWNVYLATNEIDAAAGRVAGAGGSVIAPPFDVYDAGRMAVIADPTGAVVCLWQAKTHSGFGRVREPGSVTWSELITTDVGRAGAFFAAVLGITTQTMDMGPSAPSYTLINVNGSAVAGIMARTPEMGNMPPAWAIYFEVADTDATAARAQSLGATVLNPAMDIMPGRFAVIRDPQGAVFGIIKSSPMQMP